MPVSFEQFKPIYEVKDLQGYAEEAIASLKEQFGAVPQVLEDYYRSAGRTKAFHQVQDTWVAPEDQPKQGKLREEGHLMLLNENQGACCAAVLKKDLNQPDPPVYTSMDDENWTICAKSVSEFLMAVLAYESVFTFTYDPEGIYCLTEEEYDFIQTKLTKLPFELLNWIDCHISLYQNRPDDMVAVLECEDGELQMLYGAATESSYEELATILEDVGEEL